MRDGVKILLLILLSEILITPTVLGASDIKETLQDITLGTLEETKILKENEYLIYSFMGTMGEKINVNIDVTNGGAIDVFLMDSTGFTKYQSMMLGGSSKEFGSKQIGQGMNVKSKSYSFIFPLTDRYYIAIDNTVQPNGGANPSGQVDAKISINKDFEYIKQEELKKQEALRKQEELRKQIEEYEKAFSPKETLQDITLGTLVETKIIKENEYLIYSFMGTMGEKINVNIDVTNGGAIDVFLMDSTQFTKYQSMMLGGSSEESSTKQIGHGNNVKSKSYTVTFDNTDRYYIVIDNTIQPKGGAKSSGQVDAKINITKIETPSTPTLIPKSSGFDIILAVFVITAIVLWKR
jgi:uncharacterized protein YbcI/phage-related protein